MLERASVTFYPNKLSLLHSCWLTKNDIRVYTGMLSTTHDVVGAIVQ